MAQRLAAGPRSRERALKRYLELRPAIRAWMRATVPADLRAEFGAVTGHQLQALVTLPEIGLSMGQLASSMNVSGATVSVLADRLVAQGLAQREHDRGDRRVVRLVPSGRGLELSQRYRETQRRSADLLFERLSDEQVAAFLDVLETLAGEQAGKQADPAAAAR